MYGFLAEDSFFFQWGSFGLVTVIIVCIGKDIVTLFMIASSCGSSRVGHYITNGLFSLAFLFKSLLQSNLIL